MKLRRNFREKDDPLLNDLCEAIALIKTKDEALKFFEDLCTPRELEAMADRFRLVALIKSGISYRQISADTKISVTTIGRVARSLMLGKGGYDLIHNRLLKNKRASL